MYLYKWQRSPTPYWGRAGSRSPLCPFQRLGWLWQFLGLRLILTFVSISLLCVQTAPSFSKNTSDNVKWMFGKQTKSRWRNFRGWGSIFYSTLSFSCALLQSFGQFCIFNDSPLNVLENGVLADFYASCNTLIRTPKARCDWAELQNNLDQDFTFSGFCLLKEISETKLNKVLMINYGLLCFSPRLCLHVDI